jgi:hypothetical protein
LRSLLHGAWVQNTPPGAAVARVVVPARHDEVERISQERPDDRRTS